MNDKNKIILGEKVIVRPLVRKDVDDLINAGFPFSKGAINSPLHYKILRAIKLLPNATWLSAYHVEEKCAIGCFSLVRCTPSLYSIQYVFIDPRFRRAGVATKLLNYALLLAREKGAKKCFLDVAESNIPAVNLYKKMGFIMLTRIIEGQGRLSKPLLENENGLTITKIRLRKNKNLLFNLYQRCMCHEWINFFETNDRNFINGYTHRFRRFFFRNVFINDSTDSFAIIFKHPFLSNVTVELYDTSDATTRIPMLKDIFKILYNKGIENITILLFNVDRNKSLHLLKEMGLNAFPLLCMGKHI